MKNLGEILLSQRKKLKQTPETLYKSLKIHPKYIKALENNDYSVFDSSVHARGFLKIYAEALGMNVEETLALWRREFGYAFKEDFASHIILEEDSWRGMKKCCPIVSGGLNPTKLKPFIEVMGEVNFITTMGAGVHAHPKGTNAGAKALVQSMEAYQKGIDIEEYAKNHKELKEAIEFFTKNKKEIEELEKIERC